MTLTKVTNSMIVGAVVNALDYGLVSGGPATANTVALQAAINYATSNGLVLRIPAGSYSINANLTLPSKVGNAKFHVDIRGDGMESTIISGIAPVTKIFSFGQTDPETVAWANISDMTLNGGQYALHIPYFIHSIVKNLWIGYCTSAGIYFGADVSGPIDASGYCNYFESITVWYSRIGIQAFGACNQTHFNHCGLWLNEIGFSQGSGTGTVLTNCFVESNTSAGIVIAVAGGMAINGCYFEANAATGFTTTTPSAHIQADIVLDGGGAGFPFVTEMAYYAPPTGVVITACNTAPTGNEAAGYSFVYAYAGQGVTITSCSCRGNAVPTLKTYQNTAYAGIGQFTLENNVGFSKQIKFDNQTNGATFASFAYQSILIKSTDQTNYANTDLINWGNNLGAFPASWQRKNIADFSGRATEVFEIFYNNTASSGYRTFSFNAANYPSNVGKLFVFSIDYKVETAGVVVSIYATASPGGGFTVGSTDWSTFTSYFIWPVSGTIDFGVSKSTTVNSAYFANPVLQEVGANYANANALFVPQTTFHYTAAPTVGDWLVGNIVMNSAPASGQPAGWMCTVAGAPGTWKAMANLA